LVNNKEKGRENRMTVDVEVKGEKRKIAVWALGGGEYLVGGPIVARSWGKKLLFQHKERG
jgi:hypothetical protein